MFKNLKLNINGKKKSDLKKEKGLSYFFREKSLIPKVNYYPV